VQPVAARFVVGKQYLLFLADIFEDWVRHDVANVSVQLFDATHEA